YLRLLSVTPGHCRHPAGAGDLAGRPGQRGLGENVVAGEIIGAEIAGLRTARVVLELARPPVRRFPALASLGPRILSGTAVCSAATRSAERGVRCGAASAIASAVATATIQSRGTSWMRPIPPPTP